MHVFAATALAGWPPRRVQVASPRGLIGVAYLLLWVMRSNVDPFVATCSDLMADQWPLCTRRLTHRSSLVSITTDVHQREHCSPTAPRRMWTSDSWQRGLGSGCSNSQRLVAQRPVTSTSTRV